jgi:hypothetical protein
MLDMIMTPNAAPHITTTIRACFLEGTFFGCLGLVLIDRRIFGSPATERFGSYLDEHPRGVLFLLELGLFIGTALVGYRSRE